MTKPHAHRKRRRSAFLGVISSVKYRVWLGSPDNSGGVKDSAPSRELQARSDWKVLVPVGAGSPLLLARAVSDAYLAFSSQKYMSTKLLLFLLLRCSCWHFCQPCTGFLSVLLVLGLHPCCPSLSACLPWDCWEGSGSGVLMPLPRRMNANNLVLEA